MFRPFYRALGTKVDGSGLGLAIVREIAQRHGAEVTVADARPRSGATAATPGALFTVRFPLHGAAAAPATGARARARRGRQLCTSRRLLAIDIRMPRPRPSVTIAVPP